MKTYLECIPCFFTQALEAGRRAGVSKETQKKIIDEFAAHVGRLSLHVSPPEIGRTIYGIVKKYSRGKDPYRAVKRESNRRALELYPVLKKRVASSKDPLCAAARLAVAGNIIDFGIHRTLDIKKELDRICAAEERIIAREEQRLFNYRAFRVRVRRARTILYLADNAGETVFDRVLIEEIRRYRPRVSVLYAVKEKPIINDALAEDARQCGIDACARVISSGLDAPGTILRMADKKFVRLFYRSDMIISKGQGNFEALSGTRRPVCFLFMAKCPVVARHMRCPIGSIILTCVRRVRTTRRSV